MSSDFVNKEQVQQFLEQNVDEQTVEDLPRRGYKTEIRPLYLKISDSGQDEYRRIRGKPLEPGKMINQNYDVLNNRFDYAVNQTSAELSLFGEEVAAVFQPNLDSPNGRESEMAEIYLDAAEDNLLLDAKTRNFGEDNRGNLRYFDTSDKYSVRMPYEVGYDMVESLPGDNQEVRFEDLLEVHMLVSSGSESELRLRDQLEETASRRYNDTHRLHP